MSFQNNQNPKSKINWIAIPDPRENVKEEINRNRVNTSSDPSLNVPSTINWQPITEDALPKYSFEDDELFSNYLTGLKSLRSKRQIPEHVDELNEMLEQKKREILSSNSERLRFNEMRIWEEQYPFIADPLFSSFNEPFTKSQKEYVRNVSQYNELSKAKKELQKKLEPIPKEERNQVVQDLRSGAVRDPVQTFGQNYTTELINDLSIDYVNNKTDQTLDLMNEIEPLDNRAFVWPNIINVVTRPEPRAMTSLSDNLNLINHVKKTPRYEKMRDGKREDLFIREAKKYVTSKFKPEDRKQAEKEILQDYFMDMYFYNKGDVGADEIWDEFGLLRQDTFDQLGLTIEGKKKYASYKMEEYEGMKDLLQTLIYEEDALRKDAMDNLWVKMESGEVREEDFNVIPEWSRGYAWNMQQAMRYYRGIEKTAINSSVGNFFTKEGIGNPHLENTLLMGVPGIADAFNLMAIVDKFNNDVELDWMEQDILLANSLFEEARQIELRSLGMDIGRGVNEMIPYVMNFALTAGAYIAGNRVMRGTLSALKQAAKRKLGPATTKKIQQKLIKESSWNYSIRGTKYVINPTEYATKIVSALGGTAVQAPFLFSAYGEDLAKMLTDDMDYFLDPETQRALAVIDENTALSLGEAGKKAYYSAFVEALTERSGSYLMKGLGQFAHLTHVDDFGNYVWKRGALEAAKTLGITPDRMSKAAVLKFMTKQKGFKDVGSYLKHIEKNRLGWDGVFEEYLEEFVNYWLGGLPWEEDRASFKDLGTSEFWRQQLVTFGVVAIFGSMTSGIRMGTEMAVGTDYKFSYQLGNKVHTVKVPRFIYQELKDVVDEISGVDHAKMEELKKRNKDYLEKNPDVARFLVTFASKKIQESLEKTIIEAERKRREKAKKLQKDPKAKVKGESIHEKGTEEDPIETVAPHIVDRAPTSVDQDIETTSEEKTKKLEEIQEEQALIIQEKEKLERKANKEKLTLEQQNALELANKKIATLTRQITYWTNKYDKQLTNLRDKQFEEHETQRKDYDEYQNEVDKITEETQEKRNNLIQQLDEVEKQITKEKDKEKLQQLNIKAKQIKGQITKLVNTSENKIKEQQTKQSSITKNPVPLTSKEQAIVDKHNALVEEQHPDLVKFGLLEKDPVSGQYEIPDEQYLNDLLGAINERIERIKSIAYIQEDQFGNLRNIPQALKRLFDQKAIVENRLRQLGSTEAIPFEDMMPSEKHTSLLQKLYQGIALAGRFLTDKQSFTITLPDGKVVRGYWNRDLKQEEVDSIRKKTSQDEFVNAELELVKKEDWNEDNKAIDPDTNLPYQDKIDVKIDGKIVGVIAASDHFVNREKKSENAKLIPILNEFVEKGKQNYKNAVQRVKKERKEKEGERYKLETKKNQELAKANKVKNVKVRNKRTAEIEARYDKLFSEQGLEDVAAIEEGKPSGPIILFSFIKQMMQDKTFRDEMIDLAKEYIALIASSTKGNLDDAIQKTIIHIKKQVHLSKEMREILAYMLENPENKQIIVEFIQQKRLENISEEKGYKIKIEGKIDFGAMKVPSMDDVHWSTEKKIAMHLKAYASLWEYLSSILGVSRERIEAEWIKMLQQAGRPDVANQEDANALLESMKSGNRIGDQILKVVASIDLDKMVTFLNFYNNITVMKFFGWQFSEEGIKMHNLGSTANLEEFISLVDNSLENYTYESNDGKKFKGFFAIAERLRTHQKERIARQTKAEQLLTTGSNKERTTIRLKQHEEDLNLLAEITEIPKEVWRQYFNLRETNERKVSVKISQKGVPSNEVELRNYDEVLKTDNWIRTADRPQGYLRINSNLINALLGLASNNIEDPFNPGTMLSYEDKIRNFFLSDFEWVDETAKTGEKPITVFNNLYKIASLSDDLSLAPLSARNVKGDRITTMEQSNMILRIAEGMLTDPLNNRLTKFYKQRNKPMAISVLNGIYDVNKKAGRTSKNITTRDIINGSLIMFLQGEDAYYTVLGQFGDKDKIYIAEVPKDKLPTKKQLQDIKKKFSDFDEMVTDILTNYVYQNRALFEKELAKGQEYVPSEKTDHLESFVQHYVYNQLVNGEAIVETFHGNQSQYNNDPVQITKRGGSSNSPGIVPNTAIEGGIGETYTHAIIDDKVIGKLLGKDFPMEIGDGVIFFTDEFAKALETSMGSLAAKPDEFPGTLSSSKILSTWISRENENKRGLLKGNWINIDKIGEDLPNSVYAEIRDIMHSAGENGIQTLSFKSANKMIDIDGKVIKNAFTSEGKLTEGFKISESDIITRFSKDLYIQQDLRHSTEATKKKVAIQFLSNIINLPNAGKIVMNLAKMQNKAAKKFIQELQGMTFEQRQERIKNFIMEEMDPTDNEDIFNLLTGGASLHEPGIQNYVRNYLSAAATKRTIDFQMLRTTNQEIPDLDNQLKFFRLSKDGAHYLLPECGIGDTSTRIHDYTFFNESKDREEAIKKAKEHVLKNRGKYADLFMPDGTLMTWEIEDNDGVIPGEPVMLTRVPADHPHSHTIARVKFHLKSGNFAMLDKESRLISGSDFDGDFRFVTRFFKNKKGEPFINEYGTRSVEYANNILYNLMLDYINPANFAYITTPINVGAFDSIVEKHREKKVYQASDPRFYIQTREDNMEGMVMKGILTNLNTMFSMLTPYGFDLKENVNLEVGNIRKTLKGIVKDEFGMMKIALVNLQNMAFDNSKDPKLNIIGINRYTLGMVAILLLTDEKLNSSNFRYQAKPAETHSKAIHKAIQEIAELMNGKIMKAFTEIMQEGDSETSKVNKWEVWDLVRSRLGIIDTGGRLIDNKDAMDVRMFTKLKAMADELMNVSTFLKYSKEVPGSFQELHNAKEILQEYLGNKQRYFNTSSLFHKNNELKEAFSSFDESLRIADSVVYPDTFETSKTADTVFNEILRRKTKQLGETRKGQKIKLTYTEVQSIFNNLQKFGRVYPLQTGLTNRQLTAEAMKILGKLKRDPVLKNNEFVKTLTVYSEFIDKKEKKSYYSIGIQASHTQAKFSDTKIRAIRSAFNELTEEDKKLLYAYAMFRYNAAVSTAGRSYFNYISLEYRNKMSHIIEAGIEELRDTFNVSPLLTHQIIEAVLLAGDTQELRNLADKPRKNRIAVDPHSIQDLEFAITFEQLNTYANTKDKEEFNQLRYKFNFIEQQVREDKSIDDLDSFVLWWSEFKGLNFEKRLQFQNDLLDYLSSIRNEAEKRYPGELFGNEELRSMLGRDALHESFAFEDHEMQEYLIQKLQKEYPGVAFFTNKEQFFDFIKKNTGRFFNVDTEAVGHAFGNAVFIDPDKARQTTIIHEYSHIYWDALPDNLDIKDKLRKFFIKHSRFSDLFERSPNDLDEHIILEIGRVGYNQAQIEFRGTLLQQFYQLLRIFWSKVKNLLNVASQKDLLNIVANEVFNNIQNPEIKSLPGIAMMRNHVPRDTDIEFRNEENGKRMHIHMIGSRPIISVTQIIEKTKTSPFNAEKIAEAKIKRESKEIESALTKRRLPIEFQQDEINREMQGYRSAASRGEVTHDIVKKFFDEEPITKEDMNHFERIGNQSTGGFERFMQSLNRFRNSILLAYPNAKFYAEQHVGSSEYSAAGFLDLMVHIGTEVNEQTGEVVNRVLIFDFKTTGEEFVDRKGNETLEYIKGHGLKRGVAQGMSESKMNNHKLQLFLYKELLEMQNTDMGVTFPEVETSKRQAIGKITGKFKVEGMYVVPWMIFTNPKGQITNAYIHTTDRRSQAISDLETEIIRRQDPSLTNSFGWIYFDPKDKTAENIVKSLLNETKNTTDFLAGQYKNYRQVLEALGYTNHAIDQMLQAVAFTEYWLGDIGSEDFKIDGAFRISEFRKTGTYKISEALYRLGYRQEHISSLSSEKLFYAAMYEIPPEEIDSNFKVFKVRKKFVKKSADVELDFEETVGNYFSFVPDYLDDVRGKDLPDMEVALGDRADKTKKHKSHNKIIHGERVSMNGIKEGDHIYMPYTFKSADGNLYTVFYSYTVDGINRSDKQISVIDDQGAPNIVYLGQGTVIKSLTEEDLKGKEINKKYIPDTFYEREIIEEEHFAGTKGSSGYLPQTEAEYLLTNKSLENWNDYLRSLYTVWSFFQKYDKMISKDGKGDLFSFLENHDLMTKFYEDRLRSLDYGVGSLLREFISDSIVDFWWAEALYEENRNGKVEFMPATMAFYQAVNLSKSDLFKDFKEGSLGTWTKDFTSPALMSGEYIPFTILFKDLISRFRSVHFNQSLNNKVFKKFYKDTDESGKRLQDKLYKENGTDGELIVTLYGKQYWITPEEATETGDKQVTEFIKHIYKMHELYDSDYRIEKMVNEGSQKVIRIPVPKTLLTEKESRQRFGRFGKVLHELMSEQPWDDVEVEVVVNDGTNFFKRWSILKNEDNQPVKITFRELRLEFAKMNLYGKNLQELLEDEEKRLQVFFGNRFHRIVTRNSVLRMIPFVNSGSLYNYYKNQAINKYADQVKSDLNTKFKKRRLPTRQTVPSNISSRELIISEQKHIDQMMFNNFMKDILSPIDYMMANYEDQNATKIMDYIRSQVGFNLFGIEDTKRSPAKLKYLANFLIRANSLNIMAFGVKVQLVNLQIGHTMNLIMEPKAYLTGMKRMFYFPESKTDAKYIGAMFERIRKVKNIMNLYGIATMIEDTQWKELEKYQNLYDKYGPGTFIDKYGYIFLEIAEKTIQFPLFLGMMTAEEYNSYDINGRIINEKTALSNSKIDQISRRIMYVHGIYMEQLQPPQFLTPIGRGVAQFKKWMGSYHNKFLGTPQYGPGYELMTGVIPTAVATLTAALRIYLPGKMGREKQIQRAIDRANLQKDPFSMRGIQGLVDEMMINHALAIKDKNFYQNLNNESKRSLGNGLRAITAIMGFYVAALAMGAGDREYLATPWQLFWITMMERLVGDIFWYVDEDNVEFMIQNPIPLVGWMIEAFSLAAMIVKYVFQPITGRKPELYFAQDTLFSSEGQSKLLLQASKVVPLGSLFRFLWYAGYVQHLKNKDVSPTTGLYNRINPLTGKPYTEYDIRLRSQQKRLLDKDFKDLHLYRYAMETNKDAETIKAIQEIQNSLTRDQNKARDAAEMIDFIIKSEIPGTTEYQLREYLKENKREIRELTRGMQNLSFEKQLEKAGDRGEKLKRRIEEKKK